MHSEKADCPSAIPAGEGLVDVFPNPSTGFINIDTDLNDFNVKVTDLTGRTILDKNNARKLNLSRVASGNYIIQISIAEGSIFKRIVIK